MFPATTTTTTTITTESAKATTNTSPSMNNNNNTVLDLAVVPSPVFKNTSISGSSGAVTIPAMGTKCSSITSAGCDTSVGPGPYALNNGGEIKITHSESQWNIINMLELIQQFRRQSVLWDQNNPLYKNKLCRSRAWDTIAENMKMNKLECEKKLNILRTQFRRECKRIKKEVSASASTSSSTATTTATNYSDPWFNKQKASKWFAYKSMLFLADAETCRALEDGKNSTSKNYNNNSSSYPSENHIKEEFYDNTNCNESYDDEDTPMQQESEENYEESNLYITPPIDDIICAKNETASNMTTVSNTTTAPISNGSGDGIENRNSTMTTTTKRKYNDAFNGIEESNYKNLEYFFKQNQNECLTFGEHIGYRLMRLSQRTKSIVMNIISNTLFEADMGKFDDFNKNS